MSGLWCLMELILDDWNRDERWNVYGYRHSFRDRMGALILHEIERVKSA